MENSLKGLIDSAQSVLILLPTKPYFNQVAAALSLYLSLRNEKEVNLVSSSPMTVEFNRLIGINKITQDVGNKNLVIKFSDYQSSDIERVSYDIENKQFRLTVIPKPGVKAPKKDQVQLSYSGISSDLVILVGGMNDSHFPILSSKELEGVNVVHIGTREITTSQEINIMSFVHPMSSTAELMAVLIHQNKLSLDSDIATNLLLGIEQASSNFKAEDVTEQTFRVVADLMSAGGKRVVDHPKQLNPKDYPQGSIPQKSRPDLIKKDDVEKTSQAFQESQSEQNVPQDWLQKPKIYKGTTNNS